MIESDKITYEIVESPILGDPLAPLRMQATQPSPTANWRDLLHYHIMRNIHDHYEDQEHSTHDRFHRDMKREFKSIFDDAGFSITFRHFAFDEDGNLIEL